MRNEKLHKNIHEKFGFTPTIEQALKMIEKWLEFKHSQPCPNAKDKNNSRGFKRNRKAKY